MHFVSIEWEKAMTDERTRGTAFISDATNEIGAIYADRLARRGYDLTLVGKNGDRLIDLSSRIRGVTGRAVRIVVADLSEKADLRRVEVMLSKDAAVTMLVNTAEVGAPGPLLNLTSDSIRPIIDLNVTVLTHLSYAIAQAFVQRGSGVIVNVASTAALELESPSGVYGATKAYVLALSQSLHHELSSKGVQIQAVVPGAFHTDFMDFATTRVEDWPFRIAMTAKDFVDAALSGLDQGEIVTIPCVSEISDWKLFESARVALAQYFERSAPADRYRQVEALAESSLLD